MIFSKQIDRPVDLWSIARALPGEQVALLDNPGVPSRLGSWSYLGLFPHEEFVIEHGDETGIRDIAKLLRPIEQTDKPGPALRSGLIGHISYEMLHSIERVPRSAAPQQPGNLMHFVRYGAIVAVDAEAGVSYVSALAEVDLAEALELVASAPDRIQIDQPARATGEFGVEDLMACGLTPVTNPARYIDQIELTKEEIAAGRVFELCLTHEFTAVTKASGTELYDELRRRNPSPMSAYLRNGDLEILCSSPERLISLSADGIAETRPIKGTRPRGATEAEDRHLRDALSASSKDRAENTMIVDLSRNDLGRVCDYGTVEVPEYCIVESWANVHHLVSTIRGRLHESLGPADLLRACFPGGSMTGAPKVESMTMISELEQSQRGIFSGCIGWIGDDGALDMNIVIRTIVKHGEHLSVHAGGAITADSDAQAEYAETIVKARAMAEAIRTVNEA